MKILKRITEKKSFIVYCLLFSIILGNFVFLNVNKVLAGGLLTSTEPVIITYPTSGTVFEAGKKYDITWVGGSGDYSVSLIGGKYASFMGQKKYTLL